MVDKADVYSVEEFLSGHDVSLIIPELQREFVWKDENVQKLLDSIEFHRNDPALNYLFVGGMIVHHDPGVARIRGRGGRLLIPEWYIDYDPAVHGARGYQDNIERALIAKGHPAVFVRANPSGNFTAFKSLGKKIQLIDGQQRLTVLTILARVLEKHQDIIGTAYEPRLSRIYNHSFTGNKRITHTSPGCNTDYTLALTHDPALNVGGGPLSATNSVTAGTPWSTPKPEKDNLFCQSLQAIIEWLTKQIATTWAARPAVEIQGFAQAVLEQVRLIPAAIDAPEQVHLVFRSSNAFGVRLTQGELIKNDVFYFATRAGIFSAVKTEWDAIHTALSSASLSNHRVTLDDFLFIYAQSMGITSRAKFSVKTLAKKHLHEAYEWWTDLPTRRHQGIYQTKFLNDKHNADPAKLLRFVTDLKNTAAAYSELMDRSLLESRTNAQIQKTIEGQIVLTDACKPYLLCLYRNLIYGKSRRVRGTNTPRLMNFLKPLSAILVYRYILRRDPIRYYRNAIFNLPKIFNAHRAYADKLTKLNEQVEMDIFADAGLGPTPRLLTAAQRTSIEDELEQKLLEPIMSAGGRENDLAKFILLDYEGIDSGSRGALIYPQYDASKYELEHILPKRAFRQWREFDTREESWYQEHVLDGKLLFKDPTTGVDLNYIDIGNYINKIGNMIIVEDKINGNYTQRLQGYGRAPPRATFRNQFVADAKPAPMNLARISLNQVGKLHIYRYLPLSTTTEGSMLLHVEQFLEKYQGPSAARTGTPAPALVTTVGGLSASITSAGTGLTDGAYNQVTASSTSGEGVNAVLDIEVVGGVATGATASYHASGFQVGDTITILGTDLGGAGPAGDVTITLRAGDLVDSTTGPYRWTPEDIDQRTTTIATWAKGNPNWKVW